MQGARTVIYLKEVTFNLLQLPVFTIGNYFWLLAGTNIVFVFLIRLSQHKKYNIKSILFTIIEHLNIIKGLLCLN